MRPTTLAAPAAVAGSIALVFTAAPAYAEDPVPARIAVTPAFTGAAAALTVRPMTTTPPATYDVQGGDTVWGIATRYGLRTADVLALNGLTSDAIIRPGQVLTLIGTAPAVPEAPAAPSASGTTYVIAQGDTLSGIAQRHGVTLASVFEANGLSYGSIIYPGQSLTIPGVSAPVSAPPAPAAPVGSTYAVQAGDTVWAIAQRHGVATDAVLSANGLSAASVIRPGQQLVIPTGAAMVPAVSSAPAAPAGLDAEQAANAQLIIRVGREIGMSDRAIAIALGTAMQESWLRNLDWGDRDSLGLFQQRPSMGWGTAEEVRDPVRATRVFFGGATDPNGARTRGLLDIPDWEGLSYAAAAQAVQISAFPDRYARWEQPSYAWLAALG